MTSPHRARLTIDLDALAHNRGVLAAQAPGAEIAAVVKADGYGLGVGPIARRLHAEGTRSFFVARLSEGESLRAELGERPATIYLLDGLLPGADARIAAADLVPVIATPAQAAAAALGALTVALHVDTGMNRQGLTQVQAAAFADATRRVGAPKVRLVMSHLGSAAEPGDPRNAQQLARFRAAVDMFPGCRASLAASAGGFLGPDYRFDIVRAGVSLFGSGPEERPDPRLKAVATLTAPIVDIRELQPGDRVGYGSTFTAPRAMRIAIVAAGYADGVIRASRGSGTAWAAGSLCPLVAVNMDLLAIDLGQGRAAVGDPVELLGQHALLDDVATAAGTVAHEVLVRLSTRAERVYVGD